MDDDVINSVLSLSGRATEIREKFKESLYFEDVPTVDKYLLLADILHIDLLFEITLPIALNLNNQYLAESIITSACFKKFNRNLSTSLNILFKKGWVHLIDMLPLHQCRYYKIIIESLNDVNTWRMCEMPLDVDADQSFGAAIQRDDAILFLELYKCGIKMPYNKLVPLILVNNALACFKAFYKLKSATNDKKIKEILAGPEYLKVVEKLNLEIISFMYEKNILPYSCDIWVYLVPTAARADPLLHDWLIKNIGINNPLDENLVRAELESKKIVYDDFLRALKQRELALRPQKVLEYLNSQV